MDDGDELTNMKTAFVFRYAIYLISAGAYRYVLLPWTTIISASVIAQEAMV